LGWTISERPEWFDWYSIAINRQCHRLWEAHPLTQEDWAEPDDKWFGSIGEYRLDCGC
jgi:hypothetical protein